MITPCFTRDGDERVIRVPVVDDKGREIPNEWEFVPHHDWVATDAQMLSFRCIHCGIPA